jgi:hypothetical protein
MAQAPSQGHDVTIRLPPATHRCGSGLCFPAMGTRSISWALRANVRVRGHVPAARYGIFWSIPLVIPQIMTMSSADGSRRKYPIALLRKSFY